eukprot:4210075-Prorocentrum_lima.AAC.1
MRSRGYGDTFYAKLNLKQAKNKKLGKTQNVLVLEYILNGWQGSWKWLVKIARRCCASFIA